MQVPPPKNKSAIGLNGIRVTGDEVRTENVAAAAAISNIVKSSLGPVGLDKMLVDEVGDVLVTNDGATLLRKMEVEHPAGRMLVDIARLQDEQVGDGTTSVVILAGELLRRAQKLVREGVHPTNIIMGYKKAMREAVKVIKEKLSVPLTVHDRILLTQIANTSLASKIIGHMKHGYFASLAVEAILFTAKTDEAGGKTEFPRNSIGILKQHGKSLGESFLVKGYALSGARISQGMPTQVSPAFIALLDFDLRASKLRLGISATLQDPRKVEDMRQHEMEITRERVRKILSSGANVILTTGGMDDPIQKLLVDVGGIGVRRVPKTDLRRISRVTGGVICNTLCDLKGDETFEARFLGHAECVREERFGEDECLLIEGAKGSSASLILRGASSILLDEAERALHDALSSLSRTLESGFLVVGGGSVEGYLTAYLKSFSLTLNTYEQISIAEFAESLLTIPKQLTLNAALDAPELLAKLLTKMNTALNHPETHVTLKYSGLDLVKGSVENNLEKGVVEPRSSKIKSIELATEAAVTILRIDECISLNPPPEPEYPRR